MHFWNDILPKKNSFVAGALNKTEILWWTLMVVKLQRMLYVVAKYAYAY